MKERPWFFTFDDITLLTPEGHMAISSAIREVGAAINAACIYEWTLDAACGEELSAIDIAVQAADGSPPWLGGAFESPQPYDAVKMFPIN